MAEGERAMDRGRRGTEARVGNTKLPYYYTTHWMKRNDKFSFCSEPSVLGEKIHGSLLWKKLSTSSGSTKDRNPPSRRFEICTMAAASAPLRREYSARLRAVRLGLGLGLGLRLGLGLGVGLGVGLGLGLQLWLQLWLQLE